MLTRALLLASSTGAVLLLTGTAAYADKPGPRVTAKEHHTSTSRTSGGTDGGKAGPPPRSANCLDLNALDNVDPCAAKGQPAPHVATVDVARMATDRLELPSPAIGTSPRTRSFVNLRTYLWLDRGRFRDQHASAEVPGQTVTATAHPTTVDWNTGETTVTCQGPGAPWRQGAATDCGYTYRRSSAHVSGGKYTITATVHWQIGWACTGACDTRGGAFPPMTTTSEYRLSVGEVQTTNGG